MRPVTPKIEIDLAAAFPDLERRTAVRLHPRKGHVVGATDSKLAGGFAWPLDEPWPNCAVHESALVPVLQLGIDEVPELGFWGEMDLFQLLWCPLDHPEVGWGPLPSAFWRKKGEGPWAPAPEPPDVGTAETIPAECQLHPERVREFPSASELSRKIVEQLDAWLMINARHDLEALSIPEEEGLYQYHFSVAPGTKVGGFPSWIQDPEIPSCSCGAAMEYLLTVDSAEFDGAYQRWMSPNERWVWGADYPSRKAVQFAAHLMLGDMGNVHVFVCRVCDHRPIVAVHQSS